ncbi:MAG: HlyD family type I secretion periplasmic adaptor subunit [Burkholderiaceae bacterium]|jgi:HlyD family secretion protein|nr:HlyD family type I secretion periplasmic adaptor subunit [Burkholderiaceae bacterium]
MRSRIRAQGSAAERAFLSEAEAIENESMPWQARATLYVLGGLLVAATLWASLAKVDRIVVGRGRLITTTPTIVVQPLEPSMIRSIDVQVGQIVRKGTRLATFDPTFATSDLSQLSVRHASLDAQTKRLEAELSGASSKPATPANAEELLQLRLFEERRGNLESRMRAFDENIKRLYATVAGNKREEVVLRERLKKNLEIERMHEKLREGNFMPMLKVLETQRDRLQTERDLEQLLNSSTQLVREIAKLEADRKAFLQDWRGKVMEELVVVKRERDAVADQLRKAERKNELTIVTAQADSVVQEIAKRSTGSVLKEAEPLMTLVPLDAPLEAEVEIDARYISYLRSGDRARIKLDPYPFQQYGVLEGRVRTVSEDSFARAESEAQGPDTGREAFYRARIALKDTTLEGVPGAIRFLPGMTLTAEVVFGDRTVMSYLLYPVIRSLDEGLRDP